jgi:hypothetical protein
MHGTTVGGGGTNLKYGKYLQHHITSHPWKMQSLYSPLQKPKTTYRSKLFAVQTSLMVCSLDGTEQTNYSEDAQCTIISTNMPLNKIQSNSRTGSLHNKTLIQCARSLISSQISAQTDTFTSTKNKPLGIQVLHLLTGHIKLFDGTVHHWGYSKWVITLIGHHLQMQPRLRMHGTVPPILLKWLTKHHDNVYKIHHRFIIYP